MLGLRFCARAFSSCGKRGPLFITVRGPLTIAASLVVEHRLQMRRLSSCGSRAQLFHGMWDPPRPGLKPVSPALAGRFSTTAPPGKPLWFLITKIVTPVPPKIQRNLTLPLFSRHMWCQAITWYYQHSSYSSEESNSLRKSRTPQQGWHLGMYNKEST